MGGFRVLLDWFAYLGQTLGLATTSLAARVALAALLGAAGIDKLRHPRIAAVAAINFRVIPRPWKAFGTLIGLGESAIAAAQLVPVDAVAAAGAVAAGCLSLGYVFVLGRALLAGRRFPCDCLPGLVGDVSVATLVRAFVMAAGAALGSAGPLAHAPHAHLPAAVGLAASALGIPLATLGAARAWRAYRAAVTDTDWTWVLEARAGRVFIPTNDTRETA